MQCFTIESLNHVRILVGPISLSSLSLEMVVVINVAVVWLLNCTV